MSRPVVVQHSVGLSFVGGPTKALERLLASPLSERFDFRTVFQTRPAGGVNRRMAQEMAEEIRSHKPDLIHVRGLQNEGFHGAWAARMAGVPRILVSVHGFAGDALGASAPRRFLFSRILEPQTLRWADAAYCVCHAAEVRPIFARNVRRLIPAIHNGVIPSEHLGRGAREEFGFQEEDVVAISVSRLVEDKGLGWIAAAVEQGLLERSPNLKILLVGDGPYEAVLRARLDRWIGEKRVILAGKRSDVPQLLCGSDIFIFPTLHENLSNALLESMDAGLPVVATRVGGNPEVVVDGETGFLIPPSDAEAIAGGLSRLAEDAALRRMMGDAGRARIESHFRLDQAMEKIGAAYDQLLAQP
jgi:glycosyltransferase involved in cell wall biosynthesis